MKKIYCAGGGVADIIVHPFDKLPVPGTSMKVDPILLKTGGCALNAAVALRKLGADPYLTCNLGSDYFGDFVVKSLQENGVDTSKIAEKSARRIGYPCFFSLCQFGRGTFLCGRRHGRGGRL